MLLTRDGKSVYNDDVERDAKVLQRSILKTCNANMRVDVFGMFSECAAA